MPGFDYWRSFWSIYGSADAAHSLGLPPLIHHPFREVLARSTVENGMRRCGSKIVNKLKKKCRIRVVRPNQWRAWHRVIVYIALRRRQDYFHAMKGVLARHGERRRQSAKSCSEDMGLEAEQAR